MKKLLDFEIGHDHDRSVQAGKISTRDIAIIGVALRFPGASTLQDFWRIVAHKVDCIGKIPAKRRRDPDDFLSFKQMAPAEYMEKAYLGEIDRFDDNFFGLSPREASLIDPNQRIFLEVAWEAIEDAGYGGTSLRGSNTGVFLGFGGEMTYMRLVQEVEPESSSVALPGNLPAIISGRLSHILDLRGPNLILDTTCSSALVAVHYACQGIRNGECSMAVAGTVSLQLMPVDRGQRIGIEAPDGRARTFDDRSDGTGSGEGAAAVILKSLGKALEDGDHIYAVIKGSAVNHDGNSIGLTAPNPAAQEEVIVKAWKNAEVAPETISYIEAHGTGTRLGDPIEIDGLRRAFRRFTAQSSFCAVGSVKTNIGHLDSAAGLAGLVKAVAALGQKKLPPTVHFQRPNRQIDFVASPIYVNDSLRDWEGADFPRRCGVSSFGMSGTNCHLILEEAPPPKPNNQAPHHVPWILALSAKSNEALRRLIKAYRVFLRETSADLADVCYTANTGRGHYQHRLAVWTDRPSQLPEILDALPLDHLETDKDKHIFCGRRLDAGGDQAPGAKAEVDVYTREAASILQAYAHGGLKEAAWCDNLLELYVKGAEIAWGQLYQPGSYRRISLPVYPFERKRCWLQIPVPEKERESFYHAPRFIEQPPEYEQPGIDGAVLLLHDATGIGVEVARRFKEMAVEVIEVHPGDTYRELGANQYMVTGSRADFLSLCDALRDKSLAKVIHLTTLGGSGVKTVTDLEQSQQWGVYSLLHLIPALLSCESKRQMELLLVSRGVYEVTGQESEFRPENATLFGLGRIAAQENRQFKCRCIDMEPGTGVDELFPELAYGETKVAGRLAFRRGRRYVETLDEVDITGAKSAGFGLRENGVYLITGGLGEVGQKIGKYLASWKKINLALIGRAKLPERNTWDLILEGGEETGLASKLRSIRDMERLGAEVTYYSADITNEDELAGVIADLRRKYGTVNGVIHGAAQGVGGEISMLHDETDASFARVMAPKLRGTWLLDHLTRDFELDFFIIFSSAVTIMGGMGVGAYLSASAYQDTFSSYMAKAGRRVLTIDWLTWKDTAAAMGADAADENRQIFRFLTNEEALRCFREVWDKEIQRVMIGRLNYDNIINLKEYLPFRIAPALSDKIEKYREQLGFKAFQAAKTHAEIRLQGREDGNYPEYERKLAELWGETLGIDELNIHDSFFGLGGHSLLAANLISKIDQVFKIEITLREAFDHQTVVEMAALIKTKVEQNEELEKLFETIENISDEEARILLAQEVGNGDDEEEMKRNLTKN